MDVIKPQWAHPAALIRRVAGVLDLPALVFPGAVRPEADVHSVAPRVDAPRGRRATEGPVLLPRRPDLVGAEGEGRVISCGPRCR
jgi:hypothetical protein